MHMSRYIWVRLPIAQAEAAANACDLIRDSLEAGDSQKREAAVYARATATIQTAINKSRSK